METPFCRAALHGHTGSVTGLAFSPDGGTLATGGGDTTARLWDVASGQLRATLQEHTGLVDTLAFAPDGTLLATWDRRGEGKVRLWDVVSGQLRTTLPGDHSWQRHTVFAFSPDGMSLATGTGANAQLWDVAGGRPGASLPGVSDLVFSSDGKTIATGGPAGAVRLWAAGCGGPVRATLEERAERVSAFSPDGRTLAGTWEASVRLWDASSGQLETTFDGAGDWVAALAFSPDGTTLATGSLTSRGALTVELWDVAGGRLKAARVGARLGDDARDDYEATVLAFSPDGKTLATGSGVHVEHAGYFCTAQLWDVARLQHLWTFDGVAHLAFSPDGRTVATSWGQMGAWKVSEEVEQELKTVRLWAVAGRKPVKKVCPRCGKDLSPYAVKCRFCKTEL